jgi:hypothetical protein
MKNSNSTLCGLDTDKGNVLVLYNKGNCPLFFYMDPTNGQIAIGKSQLNGKGKNPLLPPQEWGWAKKSWTGSKVRGLNSFEVEAAQKIAVEIEKNPFYGFTVEQCSDYVDNKIKEIDAYIKRRKLLK